jgi:PmbA protein
MLDEKALLEICKKVVREGQKLGADAVEVQAEDASDMQATIELGQVAGVELTSGVQIAIRVFIGKRVGSAFTNIPSEMATKDALKLALDAARATTEDDNAQQIPGPTSYSTLEGLWNDSVASAEPSYVAEVSTDLVKKATSKEPDLIPGLGGTGSEAHVSAYANSRGAVVSQRGTIGYTYLMGVAPTESGMTPAVFASDVGRSNKLDADRVVDEVVDTIGIVRKTAHGESGKFPIILHPSAYGALMTFTLFASIRGDNVARGKSMIGDKLGERIASEVVTISDDGLDVRGVNAGIADDEGVPRQRTIIIEKGILRSFIWDNYWARRMGVTSTGNAQRNKRQGLVEISTSNIILEPGTRPIDDIISEIQYGYYIRGVQGAHSSNPESGDFSVVGNPAILIENGKMIGGVHGLMVSGNVYDLLKQTEELGKDVINIQTLIGPELKVRDVDVIVKE